MRRLSLRARFWLLTLVIPFFVVSAGWVVYVAYQESLERAHIDRLSAHLYLLLAAAEPSGDSLHLPEELQESRFNQAQSGLVAVVRNSDGFIVWQSRSSLGLPQTLPWLAPETEPGRISHRRVDARPGYLQVQLPALFAVDSGLVENGFRRYVFEVWQQASLLEQESRSFTRTLSIGLVIVTIALCAIVALFLSWALRPLQNVTRELGAIEKGEMDTLSENYPKEIAALTHALNTVLDVERRQRERYRNSLGDLAHSLKTPLAVLRGAIDMNEEERRRTLGEQVARMDDVVTYQLKRASAGGEGVWHKPTPILPLVNRVTSVLQKVYADRGMYCEINVPEDVAFLADEADLMEMLGNLIDNAFKYGDAEVSIQGSGEVDGFVTLAIRNDGPGIPAQDWEKALQRGVRLDSRPIGQGIGLSVVRELVESYRGELKLASGVSDGVTIEMIMPGRVVS
ncbi:Signal transduction histidine kinase [Hahella chejuensis KCTC 2396]|uniref:histidine kinase n=1 Tax=Hahella chejuensis (strain KCTC 2396) TaxID=349521 RepID=Q2S8H0_HAHCH|nr:ATP-binding protein [Hahella chejuensis]ABC33054.1 Signal transduction histidine kinase [Hahella chejuensis KCTC 2396]